MRTEIYPNLEAFYQREDKALNGTTQSFADNCPAVLDEAGNEGCWLCFNCVNCIGCLECSDCTNCLNLENCRECAFIQLGYDAWFEKFKPITKPGTDHIAFDTHDDWEFLKTQAPNRIWTLVDCPDSGDAVIINGCRFVNRLEYYVTVVAHNPDDEYNVE